MRIGIIILGVHGGINRYGNEIIDSLSCIDKHNEYVIFTPNRSYIKFPKKGFTIKKIPLTPIKWKNLISIFSWTHYSLPTVLKGEKIDLLHSFFSPLPLTNYCKSIITINDLSFTKPSPIAPPHIYSRYLKKWLSVSMKMAQRIVVPSKFTKYEIVEEEGIPDKRIKVIYCGVSKRFHPIKDKEKIKAFKKKWGLPNRFILYVGDIIPRKNLIGLIEAFANIEKYIPHRLLIVGKKYPKIHHRFYKDLNNAIDTLRLHNKIRFFGYVSNRDLVYLYNTADLFVYPSLYEGFGLPILEAMACGTPVITSDTSALSEVAFDAAILNNPRSINDLSENMLRLLNNERLRNNLIQKGFERTKKFSWERAARELLKVYEEVSRSAY